MGRSALNRLTRRRFLHCSLAPVGLTLLVGCNIPSLPGQQPAKVPRIGFLAVGTREGRAPHIAGLLQGLREHGYEEGKTILIEYRFSEDRNERLPTLAAELVAMKVRLILASGTPASFAAKEATSTIPIVMGGIAADPVATGLIASLARPGGNITGTDDARDRVTDRSRRGGKEAGRARRRTSRSSGRASRVAHRHCSPAKGDGRSRVDDRL